MSGTTSSIPKVIDALIAGVKELPITREPVLDSDGWDVSDGWPTAEAQAQVIVGTTVSEPTAEDQQQTASTGKPNPRDEDYVVIIEIHASTGTTDQKLVRDAAFDMHNAIAAWIASDPSLGGLVITQGAQIVGVTLDQTDEERAPDGRFAIVTERIRVRNRITPQ